MQKGFCEGFQFNIKIVELKGKFQPKKSLLVYQRLTDIDFMITDNNADRLYMSEN